MIFLRSRAALFALVFTAGLHLLLFVVAPDSGGASSLPRRKAPMTGYNTFSSNGEDSARADRVRVMNSPVVFSLPSSMGFSRFLGSHDVETRKSFAQPAQTEVFLDLVPAFRPEMKADGLGALRSQQVRSELNFPAIYVEQSRGAASVQHVVMDAPLQKRFVGELALSGALLLPMAKAWEVHAMLHISAEGMVDHVFLDQPVEPAALNAAVLTYFYGLRFQPGESMNGSVALYSPEPINVESE